MVFVRTKVQAVSRQPQQRVRRRRAQVAEPPAVAGTARVVRAGYPDPTQFDPRDSHFDRDSLRDDPRWYAVDIKFETKFARQVTLADLRGARSLARMELLRRGNRLSVQTVAAGEWKQIVKMGARP
jgi:predicted RNA-binding protein with PUA-like domain